MTCIWAPSFTLHSPHNSSWSLGCAGSATLEVSRHFGFALSLVKRVLRIRTEWSTASGKSFSGRSHRYRFDSFLDPVNHRTQEIDLIQSWAAATMPHSRNEVELAPLRYGIETTVRRCHVLVVCERVEGRKPGIAVAMVEDQLSVMCRKRRQIRGHRVGQRLGCPERFLLNINVHCCRRWSKNSRARRKNATYRTAGGNAPIVEETGIHLNSPGGLWASHGFLDCGDFLRRET